MSWNSEKKIAHNILSFSDDEIVKKIKAMQYDCWKDTAIDKIVYSGRYEKMNDSQRQEIAKIIELMILPFHRGYLRFIVGDINGAFKELSKIDDVVFKTKLSDYIVRNIGLLRRSSEVML